MMNSSEPEDRKAERKKQEERARAVSAAAGNAWMFVDLGENHQVSFYREGDQITIRGHVKGVSYALDVSPRLAPADIAKAISRKAAA